MRSNINKASDKRPKSIASSKRNSKKEPYKIYKKKDINMTVQNYINKKLNKLHQDNFYSKKESLLSSGQKPKLYNNNFSPAQSDTISHISNSNQSEEVLSSNTLGNLNIKSKVSSEIQRLKTENLRLKSTLANLKTEYESLKKTFLELNHEIEMSIATIPGSDSPNNKDKTGTNNRQDNVIKEKK